jgi:hypothetical protein
MEASMVGIAVDLFCTSTALRQDTLSKHNLSFILALPASRALQVFFLLVNRSATLGCAGPKL